MVVKSLLRRPLVIKGGYYLRAKRIEQSSIGTAPPYMREIWDYLLRKASFNTGGDQNPGQLYRTYQKIVDDLFWYVGARKEKYSVDQVKKAMVFMRKHGMITTEQKPRGVLITICNYRHYQNWKNYESTAAELEDANKINGLDGFEDHESTGKGYESTDGSTGESTATLPHESTAAELEDACKIIPLDHPEDRESTADFEPKAPAKAPREPTPLYNIHQYSRDIGTEYSTEICPPPETDDCVFDRDRGIFFDAFLGVKTLQTFDDDAGRKSGALVKLVHVPGEIPINYITRLEQLNEQGAGIYMAVNETNGKGRKAEDIVKVRAVFADLDGAPIDPVWEHRPSMVVESSPGKYHAYWLTIDDPVDGVPLEGFRALQESIAVKFGSDPKVKDLPRVMRIPGFNHMKDEPFLSRIIHYTGARYPFADLVGMFPPPPREQWSAPKYQTPTTPNPDAEFKGTYGAPQGGRNNHLAARIGGMINRGLPWAEIESEAHKEGAACSPPLSGREVQAVLNSMRRYA